LQQPNSQIYSQITIEPDESEIINKQEINLQDLESLGIDPNKIQNKN